MATKQDVHKALAFLLNGMVELMAKRNIDQHRIPLLRVLGTNTARIYGPLIIGNGTVSQELRQRFANIIEYEIKAYPSPRLISEGGTYYVEFYNADNVDEVAFTRARRFGTFDYMHANFRKEFDAIAKRGRNFPFDMGREMTDATIPPVVVDCLGSGLCDCQEPAATGMRGINVSPELQALLGNTAYRTEFHLSVDTIPHYERSNDEGNLKAWQDDGCPQLLLAGGHVEHKGHTIVFFENINYGSGLHAVAVFAGTAADVTPEASPVICFRCTGRGVPCEIALPEDGDIPSMVMVPAHGDGCIEPHWYAYLAGGKA